MGQGGYLLLKNNTAYNWRKTHEHSYQMNSWEKKFPANIPALTSAAVYIEWDEYFTHKTSDDAGEIDYAMDGLDLVFQVQARAKSGFEIKIECKNFSTNQMARGGNISMGWAHDGLLVFVLSGTNGNFLSQASKQQSKNWMKNLPGSKKISELTIPGTHDTCTYNVTEANIIRQWSTIVTSIATGAMGTWMFSPMGGLIGGLVTTKFMYEFAKCQSWDITTQLNQGIRFLDIRLKAEGNTLQAYHGIVKLYITFPEILKICYSFLAENNTECILMSIKNEGSGGNPIDELVKAEIDKQKQKWYVEKEQPSLNEVRGKLVLYRRYAGRDKYTHINGSTVGSPKIIEGPGCVSTVQYATGILESTKIGIDTTAIWPENNQDLSLINNDKQAFAIQDKYDGFALTQLDHKFVNHVRIYLDLAKDNSFDNKQFINFTSGTGTGITKGLVYPKTLAKGEESFSSFKGTNALIANHLSEKLPHAYGIIPMDFPEYPGDGSLIKLLISLNQFE